MFEDWQKWQALYGDVSVLPTKHFTQPVRIGEEIAFEIERGKCVAAA